MSTYSQQKGLTSFVSIKERFFEGITNKQMGRAYGKVLGGKKLKT